ncbi:hypothetical protein OHT77_19530 [Streptomyces sp. NBC_00252]|uniref:hypothetical protein n=1 Tax=Streptomyces sp. NBC_00252 TaxID=2975691 RepID=UPI002E28FA1A|nr:hypothetical protein [Streptomyces sp. NBC_00252]
MNKAALNPTNNPQGATQGPPRASVGESEVAARKGVPSALRPNSQTGDGRYPIAWLTICTPYGATPTARSSCLCGWDRRAFGARKVLALITDHADHRNACPLRAPQEGRTAA